MSKERVFVVPGPLRDSNYRIIGPNRRHTVKKQRLFCRYIRVCRRDIVAMTEFAKFLIDFNILIMLLLGCT
jgi:hypothetical protein